METEKGISEKFENIATKESVNYSVSDAKADIIKWMFIFWTGQILALLGILYLKD